jgi:response regulator RpfG family c-di-GMP phosphodiesterase
MYLPNNAARLLIADDDAAVRSVLREFLSAEYECESVGSAEEALSLLDGGDFQLIVSDISMRGMTGIEMIPRVLERSPDTLIIMVSGSQDVESAIGAMRAGAFDYVLKPFDLELVEVAVRRALEHQRLLESKRSYETYLERMITRRTAELDGALQSLEGAYRATLKALVTALETRDSETHGHSERVVAFSLRLGRELGLSEEELTALEFGSLLHDIGKIGVPDAVLRKPAPLTEPEWYEMRKHPLHGEQILGGIEFLGRASRVVAQHHERWDGSGYPVGLRGEQIDLNARVFAVADAFDAITSDRVYRVGKSYESAARELDEWAGRQFDPVVVEAFRRVPPEEWEALRRKPSRAARGTAAANGANARRRFPSRLDGAKRGLRRPPKFQRARAY